MKKIIAAIFRKLGQSIAAFMPQYVAFICVMLVIRIIEIILDGISHGLSKHIVNVLLTGFLKDITFTLTLGIWYALAYYLFFWLGAKTARIFFIVTATLLCLIQLSLVQYAITTLVPLGADLWGYSLADIRQTVGAAGIKIYVIILLVVAVALIALAFIYLPKRIRITPRLSKVFFAILLVSQLTHVAEKANTLKAGTEQDNNLSLNKSYYFYKKTLELYFPAEPDVDIYADSYIGDFGGGTSNTKSFQYVDEANYPFLHVDSTADVLSPFMNPGHKKPNVVIILVEGLGRAFTNNGAYLGNFTPFIDSLSQKSLYWENFLSEGGRTFAVLPSLLGSLPFGKNGFCELAENAPQHLSLLSLSRHNGYNTSFFYGGDSHFDFMDVFLKNNAINNITDINSFPAGYTKMPASSSGFSWGYGDKELFRCFMDKKIKRDTTQPTLDVLLTVSTHSPFLINEEDTYLSRFEDRMTELSFTDARKNEARNYKQQYASILFTDDALRNFFASMSKLPDFNNTVFIITGDHRMPEIPMASKIDRYHVPLIIYSPMLNRTAKFSSVSTHFDVAPTLLSWLKHQYGFAVPSLASWLGTGIDTTHSFRNVHAYPFMQTKNEINGFMVETSFMDNTDIFDIGTRMDLTPIQDQTTSGKLKAGFDKFMQKNNRMLQGAKLIPDSLYQTYFPH